MKRGDVVMVDLDPVIASELGKRRPAVVLQNELANRTSPTVTLIPLSSRVSRIYPFQVHIPASEAGLTRDSKALCQQTLPYLASESAKGSARSRPRNWPRSEWLSTATSGSDRPTARRAETRVCMVLELSSGQARRQSS